MIVLPIALGVNAQCRIAVSVRETTRLPGVDTLFPAEGPQARTDRYLTEAFSTGVSVLSRQTMAVTPFLEPLIQKLFSPGRNIDISILPSPS